MNKCVSILLTTTSKTQFWGVIQRAAILTQPYTATNHLQSVLVLNTDWVVELNADKSAAHQRVQEGREVMLSINY